MNKEFSSLDGSIKKHQRETLTPYKVAVLIFIKLYVTESRDKGVIEKRDFCIAALKLIQSPDLDLKGLFKIINSEEFVLSSLSIKLRKELETVLNEGVQALLDLIDSLGNLLKPVVDNPHIASLNKHSVLGLYVRRHIIIFEKFTFYKIITLFEELKAYFQKFEENANLSLEDPHSDPLFPHIASNIWGGRQAELLVAQQAHALLTDEHKALPPAKLQALVKDLLSSSPYYAEAHYLSYLNYLRVNEYCGALDSLYHCFDRLAPLESRPADDKLRTFRYAALNLAALHAQFGYKELAQTALKEAIMLAQEAGDNVCLQLAHSWMYYLTDDPDQKCALIERSITKATALGMTHTASLALIASAHHCAMEGVKPQYVFETLMKSDVLNNQHSMIDLMSMLYAEKTALWAYYGKTEMSSVCAQLLLLFNSGEKRQLMFNGPSTCQAVVTVANILHEMGEYALAGVVLGHAKERFPNAPSRRIWALSEQLHEFDRLIRNEKWYAAEEIAQSIAVIDLVESKFRHMQALFARHDFGKALDIAYELDAMEDITPQQKVRAKLHLSEIKCGSYNAGTPMSATGCILHLSKALDIATEFHLSYYQALVKMHIANVQLLLETPFQALKNVQEPIITVLAHGGLYDQARAHVTYAKCLSANAGTMDSEESDATKKSEESDATEESMENKRIMILEAVKHLRKAKTLFERLEANDRLKSTLFLLSVFYNEVDMCEERNKCAFEFKQLDQQFPTEGNNIFLF